MITAAVFGTFFTGYFINGFTRQGQRYYIFVLRIGGATDRFPERIIIGHPLCQFFMAVTAAAVNMGLITGGNNLLTLKQ